MSEETAPNRIKVAIVGGGCAALTAAFELSDPKQHGDRYEITVYQLGFRLGGKGASGRNGGEANRTEEHGLHVWMGFYENAFRVMRACYSELPDKCQSLYRDWQEAFMPDPLVGVADKARGEWRLWSTHFPASPGLPGDPLDEDTNPFTLQGYLARTVDLLRALVRSTFTHPGQAESEDDDPELSSVSPRAIVDKITSLLRAGMFTSAGTLYEAMSILKVILGASAGVSEGDYKVLQFVDAIAKNVKKQAEELIGLDETIRPKLELIELVVTIIVGMLRDELLSDPQGLDAINDEDCRAWLRRHGASERALNSSFVRALYNMAFVDPRVFEDPDFSENGRPGLAAGQALRGALRMFFTYRGALFWKLRAGMGDVVFAPLYEVLKQRGVKFRFFHRLKKDGLQIGSDPSPHVASLKFDVQARMLGFAERAGRRLSPADEPEYLPLENGCWPSRPLFDQLEGADESLDFESPDSRAEGEVELRAEKDFDYVVLGISIEAVKSTCKALIDCDVNWRAMVDNVKTTPTQALQIWLKEGVETLTRAATPVTVSGFESPLDTWSDMTHVIAQESWGPTPPKGLVYFCGVASEPSNDPALDHHAALDRIVRFFDGSLPALWPGARDPKTGGFRWDLLVRASSDRAPERSPGTLGYAHDLLKTQYFKLNVHPSDRYVLAQPGSLQYRISPLDDTYDNLTIAGDWTDCGFNEGCVEAAVMSGRLAAHALSGLPALEDIIGYDHP
jgi:uncharacterized protein with NAD-binding domain and iron-sulfur cluster